MFRDRTRREAYRLEAAFRAATESGHTFDEATNATAILGYKAAACHSAYITVSRNLDALREYVQPADEAVYAALLLLFRLSALVQIQRDAADWFGVLTQRLVDSLLAHMHVLLDGIRPDAVGLVIRRVGGVSAAEFRLGCRWMPWVSRMKCSTPPWGGTTGMSMRRSMQRRGSRH
jgi:hypothetical protein